jgi:hypothetical protein
MVREGLFVGRMTAGAGRRGDFGTRLSRGLRPLHQPRFACIWHQAALPATAQAAAVGRMEGSWP